MSFTMAISSADLKDEPSEVLIDFVAEDTDSPPLDDTPAWRDFEAKRGNTLRLYQPEEVPADRWILIGLGEETPELHEAYELGGTVHDQLDGLSVQSATVRLDGFPNRTRLQEALLAGIRMGAYDYEEHKSNGQTDEESEDDDEDVELEALSILGGVNRLKVDSPGWIAKSVNRARDLANAPANDLTPNRLAEEARRLESEGENVTVEIWDEEKLAEENMNLHRAVSKGSGRPGRLIHLTYQPSDPEATLGLAGKGVTFDTGGISLKPSKKMHEMKFDMCGAAAVLGFVRAASGLDLPVRIEALVPAVENMPGERATCPGDVIKGRSGTTVEIINTDAEGRLILADSLAYLAETVGEELDLLVDLATLTGACVGALGHEAAGLMTPDERWVEPFREAGEACGERVWPFPLWEEYDDQLKSDTADVKNTGGKPGAITAGMFLRRFVPEEVRDRWVHLDIAGVGWGMKDKPHRPDGGTGYGVLLLLELVRREFLA